MNSQLELLELQDQEAARNTYYRSPKVYPHSYPGPDYVEIRTMDNTARLGKIDEVILYIVATFKWVPAWLAQQWFAIYNLNGYDRMTTWINVGLVWAQEGSTGVFIRPTRYLFQLMYVELTDTEKKEKGQERVDKTKYIDIPFNLLNHTCAEMQIVFDVMMGNPKSEMYHLLQNAEGLLPMFHPLELVIPEDPGITIFTEDVYRQGFDPKKTKEYQDTLIQSIRTGKPITAEFDFENNGALWTLVTEDMGTGRKKEPRLYTQRPDLVIPCLRGPMGAARSWAIEMELTPKTDVRYDKIMESYKNNLVYGHLVYLCGNTTILEKVKKAYTDCKGLGSCKFYTCHWIAPAQRITTYSAVEEQAYGQLLKTTMQATVEDDGNS